MVFCFVAMCTIYFLVYNKFQTLFYGKLSKRLLKATQNFMQKHTQTTYTIFVRSGIVFSLISKNK